MSYFILILICFVSLHFNITPTTAVPKDKKIRTYDVDYLIKQLMASRRFEQLAEKLADKTVKKFKDENIINKEKMTLAIPRSVSKPNSTAKTSLKYIDLIKAYKPVKEIQINHQNIEVTKDFKNNKVKNETKTKSKRTKIHKKKKNKKISKLLDKTTVRQTESTTKSTDHTTSQIKVTILDKNKVLLEELKEYVDDIDKENDDDSHSEQEKSKMSIEKETTPKELKTTIKKQHKNYKQYTQKETSVTKEKAVQKTNETNKTTTKPATPEEDNKSISPEEKLKSSAPAEVAINYTQKSEETNSEVGDVEPSDMQQEKEEEIPSNEEVPTNSMDYNYEQEAQDEQVKPLVRREGDKLFTFVEAPEYADYFAKLPNATDFREIVYDFNNNNNITVKS